MKFTALAAAAAVSISALAVTPAMAEQVRVPVSYADIDVTTPGGSAILAARVKVAVATACERPVSRNLKAAAEWQHCREAALDSVAEQLDEQLGEQGAATLATL